MIKNASNLDSFYGSHIDGILCVKQIDFGSARTLNKYWNLIKMSSDFNFTVTSWFLGNVHVKAYFNTLVICKWKKKGLLLSESKIWVANGPPGPPIPPSLHIYNGCNHKIHITNLLITNTLSRGPYFIMCQVLLHKVSPFDIWNVVMKPKKCSNSSTFCGNNLLSFQICKSCFLKKKKIKKIILS